MGNSNSPPSHRTFVSSIDETPKYIQEKIHKMYYKTYSKTGEKLWFGRKEEISKSKPYGVAYVYHDSKGKDVRCAVLFENQKVAHKQYVVKISLIIHSGTQESKHQLFDLLCAMLSHPGVYIEASGAVSWFLRKKHTPIILSHDIIMGLLRLPPDQSIVMNPVYKWGNKCSQVYIHLYWSSPKGGFSFADPETMFGTPGQVS
jgi:hypothetical protein